MVRRHLDGAPGRQARLRHPYRADRGVAKAIHPRMPLILDQQSLEPWLDPELTDRERIRHLVHHLPHDLQTHWLVCTRVNRPVDDDPALIEALP